MRIGSLLAPVVIIGGLFGAIFYLRSPPPPPDRIISTPSDDAALVAARTSALETLPQFWREFDAAPAISQVDPDRFGLKLALLGADGTIENIWTGAIERRGERVFARLANEPNNLPNLRLGSEVEVDPATIVDWSIRSADGMYGHYSTRALLAHMPPEEADQIRALLSADPTPPHWSAEPTPPEES